MPIGRPAPLMIPPRAGSRWAFKRCVAQPARGAFVEEKLPIREETRLLCARYGMNPLGPVFRGFLFTAAPEEPQRKPAASCGPKRYPRPRSGAILPACEGLWIEKKGKREPLAFSEQDEIGGAR